ncbi:MICOS complex subunit Mic60 isoform X1 [Cylas formicarius]|uniref:MICOS complex subunit Mic60 isoform X1 n=1 Tax=Cylas formicarius TaxID=197179 RepID=UPI0029584A0E|nr:MICOS complex subunit Mic60 isoform X1 [Cylas formicarius]
MVLLKNACKLNKRIPYLNPYTTNPVSKQSIPFRRYSNVPSPTSKGSGRKVLLTLGTLTIAGGATIAYAEYDPHFRNKLKHYLPFTEPVFKTLEDVSLSKLYDSTKELIAGAVDGGEKPESEEKNAITVPKEKKAPIVTIEKGLEKAQEMKVERKNKIKTQAKVDIDTVVEPTSDRNVADLERKLNVVAGEALKAYASAIGALSNYNHDVERVIDEAVDESDPAKWETLREQNKTKRESINRARTKASEAVAAINELKEFVSRKDFPGSEVQRSEIQNKISKVQSEVQGAASRFESELKRGRVAETYWDKVEKARKHFSEELEILFPNVDLEKRKLAVNEDELDLFLLHAYNNVLFYQKELAKVETLLRNAVEGALQAARLGDQEPLVGARVLEAVERERRKLAAHFQQQVLKLRKESESELRNQLKRQSQTFNDHLGDAVGVRGAEIERQLALKFDEALEAERLRFKTQLAAITGKLRGLDDAVKARNEADSASKQAQVLWSACQSLSRTIRAGLPGIPWKEQIRPLEPELRAVLRAAATNDELVSVVVETIPREARERGVYPEDALRERFLEVAKTARQVALVPAEGAALPVHILSYLESLLLIKSANPITSGELKDEPTDYGDLDTNDILQRARFWLDRGDFAQTLKYMNLLRGAPRRVASQWMKEARILLEAQQAANTLMAHAASSGLVYL